MERGYDYITNANYPIEMNVITRKLCEFCQGNDFNELIVEAIMNNSGKIKSDFMPRIKKQGENLADSKKADYLAEFGIPDFDESLKRDILNLCSRIFNGSNFDQTAFFINLEKHFYSSYTKRLLQKTHFYSEQINHILNSMSFQNSLRFQNHLYGYEHDFVIETRDISQNIGVEINHIERIYPKLQKILDKKCYENFMQVFKDYIHSRLHQLSKINIDTEEFDLLKLACQILHYYENGSSECFKFLQNLVELCFRKFLDPKESKIFWGYINVKLRIDIYIYMYLIASKKLPALMNIPKEYYSWFIDWQFQDISRTREILRKISKRYKIFIPSPDNTHFSYVKNPFECFKIIETNTNQYFLDRSMMPNPEIHLNTKKFKKLTSNNSDHIVILVSGYLSQFDNHKTEWKNLIRLYPNDTFYSYTWKSSTLKNLILSVFKLSFGRRHFNEFYLKAEEAGIKLSQFLTDSEIFKGKSISLVGFSLGTVVINSCLQKLSTERMNSIHDCILMGSALDIRAAQYNQYLRDYIVTGKFYNIFSTKDFILNEIFCLTAHSSPFGITRVPGMKNKDMSDIIFGHKKYREKLGKIFKRIKNF